MRSREIILDVANCNFCSPIKVAVRKAAECEDLRFLTLDLCWTIPRTERARATADDATADDAPPQQMDYLDGSCLLFAQERFVNFLDYKRACTIHRKFEMNGMASPSGAACDGSASNFGCLKHSIESRCLELIEKYAGDEDKTAVVDAGASRFLPQSLLPQALSSGLQRRGNSDNSKATTAEEAAGSAWSPAIGTWVLSRFGGANGAEYVAKVTGVPYAGIQPKVDVKYADGGTFGSLPNFPYHLLHQSPFSRSSRLIIQIQNRALT